MTLRMHVTHPLHADGVMTVCRRRDDGVMTPV